MAATDPWEAYARLQKELDNTRVLDTRTSALEATLNRLADPTYPVDDVDRSVRSGRRQARHRARLLRAHSSITYSNRDPSGAVDAREMLYRLRARVTVRNWALLVAVAQGHQYDDLAGREGVSPSALRARVCRLRGLLRLMAAVVLDDRT